MPWFKAHEPLPDAFACSEMVAWGLDESEANCDAPEEEWDYANEAVVEWGGVDAVRTSRSPSARRGGGGGVGRRAGDGGAPPPSSSSQMDLPPARGA